jgi:hypothetical protein
MLFAFVGWVCILWASPFFVVAPLFFGSSETEPDYTAYLQSAAIACGVGILLKYLAGGIIRRSRVRIVLSALLLGLSGLGMALGAILSFYFVNPDLDRPAAYLLLARASCFIALAGLLVLGLTPLGRRIDGQP